MCRDRAGVLCRTLGVVWWLSEASMRRVCFPACLLVTYGDSWAFILLESAQGSSRKGTLWVRWSVCWDRAGVPCRTRGVVWWLSEANRRRVCVPGCHFVMWGGFRAFYLE